MSFFGIKFSENIFNHLPKDDDDQASEDDVMVPKTGICDSAEQFAKKFPKFSGDVYFYFIQRYKQPAENGWKWEGSGDYYGEFDLSNIEYLYQANGKKDRPQIDVQCIFSLKEPKNSQMFRRAFIDHGKVV